MEGLAKAALVLMLSDVLCAHMNIVFQNVCPNVTFTSLICHPLLTFFFLEILSTYFCPRL